MKKRWLALLVMVLGVLLLGCAQAETRTMMLVSTWTNNAAPTAATGYSGVYTQGEGFISLAPLDKTTWKATLQAAKNYAYTGVNKLDSLVGLPVTVTLDDAGRVTNVALLGKKLTCTAARLTSDNLNQTNDKGYWRVKGHILVDESDEIKIDWAKLNFSRLQIGTGASRIFLFESPRSYVRQPDLTYQLAWHNCLFINQKVDENITLVDTDGNGSYDWIYTEYVLNGLQVQKAENGVLTTGQSAGSAVSSDWVTAGLAYEYNGTQPLKAGDYVNIRLKADASGTAKTVNNQKINVKAVVTPATTVTGVLTAVQGAGTSLSCTLDGQSYAWTAQMTEDADGTNGANAGRTSLEGWKGQEVTLVLDEAGLVVRAFLAPEKEYMLVSTWTNNAAPVADTGFGGMYSAGQDQISLTEIGAGTWRETLAGSQNYRYTGSGNLDALVGLPVHITKNAAGEITKVEALGSSYTCRASEITSTNAAGIDTSRGYARRMGAITVGASGKGIDWKTLNYQYQDKSYASARVYSRNPTTSYGTNWSGNLMLVGVQTDELVTLVDTDGDNLFDWIYTQCVLNGARLSEVGDSLRIGQEESTFGSYTERNSWLRAGLKMTGASVQPDDYVNIRILPSTDGTSTVWRGQKIGVTAQVSKADTVTGRMTAVQASKDYRAITVTLDGSRTYTWTNFFDASNADGANGEKAGRTLMTQDYLGKKFTLVLDESGLVVRAVPEKEKEYMLVSTWTNNIGNNGSDFAGMHTKGEKSISLAVVGDTWQATLRTATNCRYTGPNIDDLVGLPVNVQFDGNGNVVSVTQKGKRVDCMAGQLTGGGDSCFLNGQPISMDWASMAFTSGHESPRAYTKNSNMTYSSNWSGARRFFGTKCDERVTLVDTDEDGSYDWIYSDYVMNGSEVATAYGNVLKTVENPMGSASFGGWGMTRIRYQSQETLSAGDFVDIVFSVTTPENGMYKADRNGAPLYGLATVTKAKTVSGTLNSADIRSPRDITCVVDGVAYTWTDQFASGSDGANGVNAGRTTLADYVGKRVTLVLDRMGYVVRAVYDAAVPQIPAGAVPMMLVSTSTNNIGINDRSGDYDGVYSKKRGSVSLADLDLPTWRDTLKSAKNYQYKGKRDIDSLVGLPVAVVFGPKDTVEEIVPLGTSLRVNAGSLTTAGGRYYANGKPIELDWRMLRFDEKYESARCYTKNANFTYSSNWSGSSLFFDTHTDELVTLVDTNGDGKYDWIYSDPVWNGVRVRGMRRHQIKGWSFPVGSWSYNGWTARWIYCDLLDDTIKPNDYVNIRYVATEPNKAIYIGNRNGADLYIKAVVSRADTVTGTLQSITRKSATGITCRIDGVDYTFSGRIAQNVHADGQNGVNSGRQLWTDDQIGSQVSAVLDASGNIVRCFVGQLPNDASVPGTGDARGQHTRWLLAAGAVLLLAAGVLLILRRAKARSQAR